MKLNALTGDIYDVATKQRCATLTAKKVREIQNTLRQSKDFAEKIALLLPDQISVAGIRGGNTMLISDYPPYKASNSFI